MPSESPRRPYRRTQASTRDRFAAIAREESRSGSGGHFADLLQDQKQISPVRREFDFRMQRGWCRWEESPRASSRPIASTAPRSRKILLRSTTTERFPTAGLASLVGAGAGLYLFSYPTHNVHWRETGFLAGEAALNSLINVEALKYSLQRERPNQGSGSGQFFNSGTSFPSEHAAVAWSIAGVIAHEYPGTLPETVCLRDGISSQFLPSSRARALSVRTC